MRSLEMSQKTVDFCRQGSDVVGLASQKVAEKRYAPVRKVCDHNLWVRCEASRPGGGATANGLCNVQPEGEGRVLSRSYTSAPVEDVRIVGV